jgi:hypothetical protein
LATCVSINRGNLVLSDRPASGTGLQAIWIVCFDISAGAIASTDFQFARLQNLRSREASGNSLCDIFLECISLLVLFERHLSV